MEYKVKVLHSKPRFKFIKNLKRFLRDEHEKKAIKGFRLEVSGISPAIAKEGEYE